ncbi:MAG: thioredoxin fold domain-containing protein [Gemmataceae bacterium]
MGTVVRGLVSVAILAGMSGLALGSDVPWRSHYATAKKEARARKMPMLIVISCPGCGWCDKLHSSTFTDPHVAQTLKSSYVPVSVVSRNDPWLMQALSIQAYPTLILATADGDILFRHEGYLNANQMQQQLEQVALISKAQPMIAQVPTTAPIQTSMQPVQPVNYVVEEVAEPVVQVGAPSMSSSPYQVVMPVSQKIEQARYEMIKSAVPAAPQVVPMHYEAPVQQPVRHHAPMQQQVMTAPVSAPMPTAQQPIVESTSMRELNPIGPRYYGYPPPSRSPYAK